MAGEEQYYSPIVNAMIASAQKQQQAEQLKAQVERQKADLAQRKVEADTQAHHLDVQSDLQDRQLKEATREHDILAEHNSKLLDLQSKAHDLQQQSVHAGILKTINELSSKGFDVRGAAPLLHQMGMAPMQEVPQGDSSQIGGMSKFQIQSPFTTPGAAAEAERLQARAQSQGAAEGAMPSQQAILDKQHQNALDLAAKNGANQIELAKTHGAYQLAGDRINGEYHLKGLGMLTASGLGDQGGQAQQLTDGLFNGNVDYSKLTPAQKNIVQTYAKGTGELSSLPTDTKDYSKKLDALSGLQVLLNQYRDLAKNYSVNSPDSFSKGNYNIRTGVAGTRSLPLTGAKGELPGSDLDSKLKAATGSAGQLTTTFEQSGRKSDATILRQVGSIFDPKATDTQNMDKINSYVQQVNGIIKNLFPGMKEDRINKVLGDRGIVDFGGQQADPEWLKSAPAVNKAGHKLNKQLSIQYSQPVYQ